MSAGIVCVKIRVNIYRKFKFFPAFKPFFLIPYSLPYNTDATGHDIIHYPLMNNIAEMSNYQDSEFG